VGVLALSHFDTKGIVVAVGEQPIKGLVSPAAQARMTVGEALTNMVWARVSSLKDIKASCNWMWAAKLPGEGAKMWVACEALCDLFRELGPGIDGGKDSLSMSANINGETVKSPGQVTLTCYAACPDITLTVTPDLKYPGAGVLLYIDLGGGKHRLGGSALSTVYDQIGDEAADVEDAQLLKRVFNATQSLLDRRVITAGHDRSDGGLLVTLLEMSFAGNCGIDITIPSSTSSYGAIGTLFSEELGLVIEVLPSNVAEVMEVYTTAGVPCVSIGSVTVEKTVTIRVDDEVVLSEAMPALRDVWESTSSALEMRQVKKACAISERDGLQYRTGIPYTLTFPITSTPPSILLGGGSNKHKVAVIRQEGSNGDREMLSAFYAAGLEPWDVNMRDLLEGSVRLDMFRGIVFCGGFSYADVNDSAKVTPFIPSGIAFHFIHTIII
jgi:phosphoribosylformylglycinamidine synthase